MRTYFLSLIAFFALGVSAVAQNPNNDPSLAAKSLLDPDDHVLFLVDHEGQMAFAVQSIDIQTLRNNTGLVEASYFIFFPGPFLKDVVGSATFSQIGTSMNVKF